MQVDVIQALYEDAKRDIREAVCRTQCECKLDDLPQAQASPVAAGALQRIGQLYSIGSELGGRAR